MGTGTSSSGSSRRCQGRLRIGEDTRVRVCSALVSGVQLTRYEAIMAHHSTSTSFFSLTNKSYTSPGGRGNLTVRGDSATWPHTQLCLRGLMRYAALRLPWTSCSPQSGSRPCLIPQAGRALTQGASLALISWASLHASSPHLFKLPIPKWVEFE